MELQKINEDSFDAFIQSDEPVMVDFYATWCESCKAMMPILEKVVAQEGKKIAKVDIDENRGLVEKYGLKSIPTLMVFQNGELKETSIGRIPKDKVLELLSK